MTFDKILLTGSLVLMGLFALVMCDKTKAQDDQVIPVAAPAPTVNVSRNLTVAYPDGCEKGFGPIVIQLQPGTEFHQFVVDCGKVVDVD